MIAPDCNVETFLRSMEGKDLMDLLYTAEQEAVRAERLLYSRNAGPKSRETCGGRYATLLKHFIWFMRYGCRPRGIDPSIFDRFRAIKESVAA